MPHRARSHAPRGHYGPDFWMARGLSEQPSNREKFLALTIDELAKSGPHSFNATLICDFLGITYPMVNHYFGNRNGLVAEAVALAYRRYIMGLREAAEQGGTPQQRLESWIYRQIQWTADFPGIAVVLDFPESSLEITTILRERYQEELTALFEFNMAVVMHLVGDVQSGTVTPIPFEVGDLPRTELFTQLPLLHRASSIGLATMGAAVWGAGRHTPGSSSVGPAEWRDDALRVHVATLVNLAASPLE